MELSMVFFFRHCSFQCYECSPFAMMRLSAKRIPMQSPKASEGNEREREACQRQDKENQWIMEHSEGPCIAGPIIRMCMTQT